MPEMLPDGGNIPADVRQQLASRLHDTLAAAPDLARSPGLALGVAKAPGNVVHNAQSVAAVAHSHAIEKGVQRVAHGVGPDATLSAAERLQAAENRFKAGGSVAPVEQAQAGLQAARGNATIEGEILPAAQELGRTIGSIPRAAGEIATGQFHNQGGDNGSGGIAPGVTTPQFNAGIQQQVGGDVQAVGAALNPNQVFQTPSHIFRYAYDVRARHGNAAMIEALLPLVGGTALGYALTHSAKGAEEGGALATDVAGNALDAQLSNDTVISAQDKAIADRLGAQGAPSSAAIGQRWANRAQTVLTPAVVPTRAAVRAFGAVTSSPEALGGESAITMSGHVVFPDSWQRTADATKWKLPNGKGGPTFGQLAAETVGLTPHSKPFGALSGALDAFMFSAIPDPLGAAGRVYSKARGTEGLGGFLGQHWGGTSAITPEAVESAYVQNAGVRAQIHALVGKSEGQIAHLVPEYAGIADRLAAHNGSPEGLLTVFKDAAATNEIVTTSAMPQLRTYGKIRNALGARTTLFKPAPTVFDNELQKFVGRQIPMNSPQLAPAVFYALRASGMTRTAAEDVAAHVLAQRDPIVNGNIVRNAYKDLVMANVKAALPKDASSDLSAKLEDSVNNHTDELLGGTGPGHRGQFGRDMKGGDLSLTVKDPGDDASSYAMALWFNQHDHFVMPNPREIQQLVRDLAQMEKWTAKNGVLTKGLAFEQLVDHYVNERIFQPMALATGGWATRVSIAELAQNVFRQGPLNLTAARVAASAAKQNWKLSTAEMPHFVAAVRGVLSGVDQSIVKSLGKEHLLDSATALTKMFDGHIVHPALDSTHNPMLKSTDMSEIAAADIRARNRRAGLAPVYKIKGRPLSDTYTILAPGNTGYFRSWSEYAGRVAHDQLGEVVANAYADALDSGKAEQEASLDAINKAKAYLDSLPKSQIDHMGRHYARSPEGITRGRTPHEDWAVNAVAAFKGTIYGQDGKTLHRDLLDDMVNKTVPDTKGMIARYGGLDDMKMPQAMPGREVRMEGGWDRIPVIANSLHSHLLGPIVNALSREPTYLVDFAQERKLLAGKVKLGELTQDQADVLAATRAAHKSIRFVHNPIDRLKVENMMHTYAPFYFAQNQAIRRVGRLFATNPGAFEQYVKSMLAVNNIATQVAQRNGLPLVVVPFSYIAGEGVTGFLHAFGLNPIGGVPIGLTATVSPSSTVNPFSNADTGGEAGITGSVQSAFLPRPGMAAGIPLKLIQDAFSQRAPMVSGLAARLLGPVAANQPLWTQGVPNSLIQHLAQGIAGYASTQLTGGQGSIDLGSSYTSQLLHTLAAEADRGQLPDINQLLGSGYPSDAPAKADMIKHVNNVQAMAWLFRTLVSFASPVSVSLSQADLKETDLFNSYKHKYKGDYGAAIDAMARDHPDLVPSMVLTSKSPNGYAYPETEKAAEWIAANRYAVTTYRSAARWLMPSTNTAGNFSDHAYQMELGMGLRKKLTPSEFFDQIWVAAMSAHYYDYVKPLVDQAIKSGSSPYEVYKKADADLAKYGHQYNPIGYAYWTSQQTKDKRIETVNQMRTMLADPQIPKTPEAQHLGYLVHQYDLLNAAATNGEGTAASRRAVWEQQMNATMTRWPDTKPVIQSLFLGLG